MSTFGAWDFGKPEPRARLWSELSPYLVDRTQDERDAVYRRLFPQERVTATEVRDLDDPDGDFAKAVEEWLQSYQAGMVKLLLEIGRRRAEDSGDE